MEFELEIKGDGVKKKEPEAMRSLLQSFRSFSNESQKAAVNYILDWWTAKIDEFLLSCTDIDEFLKDAEMWKLVEETLGQSGVDRVVTLINESTLSDGQDAVFKCT